MNRRASDWRSTCMIHNLTLISEFSFRAEIGDDVTANPDPRLSKLLDTPIEDEDDSSQTTLGDWLVTFHPSKAKGVLVSSLKDFLAVASGASEYKFAPFSSTFHDLLVSSLYAYLCLMKRIHSFISDGQTGEIRQYIGKFSNAIRILYYMTHSRAMKIYFSNGVHPLLGTPLPVHSKAAIREVNKYVSQVYKKQCWEGNTPEVKYEEDKEDAHRQEEEDFNPNGESIYRRSFMSFVDHFASLYLLERRSACLPRDESIKLSLVSVKQSESRYFPWEEMEKVIHEMCKDGSTTYDCAQGQDMIKKIKTHLEGATSGSKVIKNFQTLLAHHSGKGKASQHNYPSFDACIHCESSLAAILCQLYDSHGQDDAGLGQVFQACPSPHYSSSFIP
jgi:hypothetical protein